MIREHRITDARKDLHALYPGVVWWKNDLLHK